MHSTHLPATTSADTRRASAIASHVSLIRTLGWALVPALAMAAYLPVLRIGFLADDLALLTLARNYGVDPRALLPTEYWPDYRPVVVLFVWELGWQLWGFD